MEADPTQRSLVFSGVFAIVWIGEALVTVQIKLLGGNMYDMQRTYTLRIDANTAQSFLPVSLHYRLHPLPSGHRLST